jgi:hypothetical protein
MVKEIQNQIGPSLDDFAAVLWSNENGGHDGRLSELRRAGRAVVTETDKILGPGR